MSVLIMSRVWAYSQHKGGNLLVLLALADFSNDAGEAYPSIKTIAKKSRLSERQVQRAIQEIVDSGELRKEENGGVFGSNRYTISVSSKGDAHVTQSKCHPVTFTPSKGDAHVTRTVNNRQEVYTSRARFTPPSLDDVKSYGQKIELDLEECELFWHHFESNGWKVSGKAPMKSWQSAMITWRKNVERGAFGRKPSHTKPGGFRPPARHHGESTNGL